MNNNRSDDLGVDGTAVRPGPVQTPSDTRDGAVWDEPGDAGQGDGPPEHSLLSRPAVPQGRRSLFRR